MHTTLTLLLVAGFGGVAPAQDQRPATPPRPDHAVTSEIEHALAEIEAAVEEAAREIARAVRVAQRRDEARTAERPRQVARATIQRDREAERAQRERERAADQARRDRERAEMRRRAEQTKGAHVQTERITRTLRLGDGGELDISNVAGDIVIKRGSGSETTVDVVKTARGTTDEEARELLQLMQVDIIERGGRAEIRARYPRGDEMRRAGRRTFGLSMALNISAPAETRLRVHTISGSVTSTDIKGEVAFESVSGSIRIANGGRVAAAKSISGSVEVLDTQSEGLIEASTASGSVTLRRVKARAVEVGSVSGAIVLDDVASPRVEAQSVSGRVQLTSPLASGGRYELSSHSGELHIAIPDGTGFELEATSFSGSIRTDFPIKTQGSQMAPGSHGRSMHGVHGDGRALLDLTTFSGGIVIARR